MHNHNRARGADECSGHIPRILYPVVHSRGYIKMWELQCEREVIKEMYRSAVLLDRECSEAFDV